MFQKALQFKVDIILCYNKQNTIKISGRVPPFLTCDIFQIIVDFFSLVVSAWVLNLLKLDLVVLEKKRELPNIGVHL
jgi:hypothetical protein